MNLRKAMGFCSADLRAQLTMRLKEEKIECRRLSKEIEDAGSLQLFEGISDGEPVIYNLTVLQILCIENVAAGFERGSDD